MFFKLIYMINLVYLVFLKYSVHHYPLLHYVISIFNVIYCIPFGTFLRKYIFAIHTIKMFKFYSYPLGREGSGHNCKLQLFQFCDYLETCTWSYTLVWNHSLVIFATKHLHRKVTWSSTWKLTINKCQSAEIQQYRRPQ